MKCRQCGQEFKPTHGNQQYCSLVCRDRHSGRNMHSTGTEGTCVECGATFTKKKGNEKYCSLECRRVYSNRNKVSRYVKKAPIAFVCECCGRMAFTNKPNAKYCSDECKHKSEWQHQVESKYGSVEAYQAELKRKKQKRQLDFAKRKQEERKRRIEEHTVQKECIVCGKPFTTLNPAQKTCSKECGKRLSYARKQNRIPKEQIVDKDITLEALYRRDSGVCYLCGQRCDWNDRDTKANIVGKNYPTIDHIIPVARGGLHSWNNVRLAHFWCNTMKSDSLLDGSDELIPENAYQFKRDIKPCKKVVYQYERNGTFVAQYESTAEAERITKIKQKGIQNCARGECKSYRGYVWKYAG